jgi:hypothetical protein
VQEQLHLISVNPVIILRKNQQKHSHLSFFLGEEKPQPFISLDIDRQVDGKVVISNHININPPNGRLPMSLNYVPNTSMPLPPHLSQHQQNLLPSSPLTLDGGVYQGQQPPPMQSNEWNPNTRVKCFF